MTGLLRDSLPASLDLEVLTAVGRNDVSNTEFERHISAMGAVRVHSNSQIELSPETESWILGVCLWSSLDMAILGLIEERIRTKRRLYVLNLDEFSSGPPLTSVVPQLTRIPIQSPFLARYIGKNLTGIAEGREVAREVLMEAERLQK